MSTRLSRAMGLVLAIGATILGLALIVAAAPATIGRPWPLWALTAAYFGSLTVGLVVSSLGGLGILYWLEARNMRRFRNDC